MVLRNRSLRASRWLQRMALSTGSDGAKQGRVSAIAFVALDIRCSEYDKRGWDEREETSQQFQWVDIFLDFPAKK